MPVEAQRGGQTLPVAELRVRYLILEAGGYRIIDRSNRVVDGGHYQADAHALAARHGHRRRERPERRAHHARDL